MKRFWWDEKRGLICWDEGVGTPMRSDESGQFFSEYKGGEPREVGQAEHSHSSGAFILVPKEPVRVKTLREAAERWMLFCVLPPDIERWKEINNDGTRACVELCEAIEREKQQPANPYTREAVDELLDAVKASQTLRWINIPDARLNYNENIRTRNAFQALLRQGEAGKAGA